jgi:hypothetical protein
MSPFQGFDFFADLTQGDAALCPGLYYFAPLGAAKNWVRPNWHFRLLHSFPMSGQFHWPMPYSSCVNQGAHIETPQGVNDCWQRLLPEPNFHTPSGRRLDCNHVKQSKRLAFDVREFEKKPGLTGLNRAIPGYKDKIFFVYDSQTRKSANRTFPEENRCLPCAGIGSFMYLWSRRCRRCDELMT